MVIALDMWGIYLKRNLSSFGSGRLRLATADRQHASLAQIADRSVTLEPNAALLLHYAQDHRYVLCKDLTYDMLISVYGVDTRSAVVLRISKELSQKDILKMGSWASRLRDSNLEFRAIGLQDGYLGAARDIEQLRRRVKSRLMEIDLFGTDIRHIAIDLKTGVPYNLLMIDRIYRPGELACQVKREEFAARASELSFV